MGPATAEYVLFSDKTADKQGEKQVYSAGAVGRSDSCVHADRAAPAAGMSVQLLAGAVDPSSRSALACTLLLLLKLVANSRQLLET